MLSGGDEGIMGNDCSQVLLLCVGPLQATCTLLLGLLQSLVGRFKQFRSYPWLFELERFIEVNVVVPESLLKILCTV